MRCTVVGFVSIIGLASFSLGLKADILVGPGGAFQPWSAAVLGPAAAPTYGGPYWNNFSGDGPAANIGWCLTGAGGCVIAAPPGPISYYGAGMNAVQNMSFTSSGIPVSVSLLGAFTNQTGGANGVDYFGWYVINPNGTIGAMTTLWNSLSAGTGTSAIFTPGGNYGFFVENVQGNGAADYFWFMNAGADYSAGSGQNPVDGLQHFAVFNGTPGTFFIGVEDGNNGDGDFNDMILKVTVTPEPRTIFLLGTGLLIFGAFRLKRQSVIG